MEKIATKAKAVIRPVVATSRNRMSGTNTQNSTRKLQNTLGGKICLLDKQF